MKKIVSIVLLMGMILTLFSCGGMETTYTAKEIADTIVSGAVFSEDLSEVSKNALLRRYGIDESEISDAAGYSGTRAVVDEVAVFIADDVDAVLEKINTHIESQKTNYSSYAPNEVPKLEKAAVEEFSNCVIVCVSDNDTAELKTIIDNAVK